MRKRPEGLQTISARLPKKLLEAADKYLRDKSPVIRDRTHLLEVALSEKINFKPSK